jgi:hypothetical protein
VEPGVPESNWSGPFSVSADVTWRDAPAEIILFDAGAERYHVLNEQAAEIWRLLAGGASVSAAARQLSARYGAGQAEIEADVAELARDLVGRGLLSPEPPA